MGTSVSKVVDHLHIRNNPVGVAVGLCMWFPELLGILKEQAPQNEGIGKFFLEIFSFKSLIC